MAHHDGPAVGPSVGHGAGRLVAAGVGAVLELAMSTRFVLPQPVESLEHSLVLAAVSFFVMVVSGVGIRRLLSGGDASAVAPLELATGSAAYSSDTRIDDAGAAPVIEAYRHLWDQHRDQLPPAGVRDSRFETFAASPGQSACGLCPAGQYTDAEGLSACSTCPAGTTTAAPGAASASLCAAPGRRALEEPMAHHDGPAQAL